MHECSDCHQWDIPLQDSNFNTAHMIFFSIPSKNMADKECACKENLKVGHTYVK